MRAPSLRSQSNRHLLNPRILVVDPGVSTLHELRQVIGMAAPLSQIAACETGEEGLMLLQQGAVHVMITELSVGKLGGLNLLAEVAKRSSRTVRIVHSSQVDTLGRDVIAPLAHKVLSKPASTHDLLAATRWALNQAASPAYFGVP